MSNLDLWFIGNLYESYEIPREKRYLLKYFRTTVQSLYLKYVFLYGNHINFVDHTGYRCQERWLKILDTRLQKLQAAHAEAKKNLDLTTLAKIEKGKYKIN